MINCYLLQGQGVDYESTSAQLEFVAGSERVCHNVIILQDTECEPFPESFFASLTLMKGNPVIIINPNITEVIIDDSNENDCGKFKTSQWLSPLVW